MKRYVFGLLFFSLFLSGCWDRRELDRLAIAVAVGIDKADDEYQVSAQVVVPSEMSVKEQDRRFASDPLYCER